ncbi:hypothetical protein P154DRAFT_575605 [Amniculicola lignicola CBS 123094]|uniref:Uncharacterized protein n=1 Tax=Amniculicola lignicola CBS 123094 TaxID=1392246 RepID=A0A6A5WHG9_9PLEO|nr:hypothetical protein P154DRAFT_575605 [Amniculicola lignicola CBS 123094]
MVTFPDSGKKTTSSVTALTITEAIESKGHKLPGSIDAIDHDFCKGNISREEKEQLRKERLMVACMRALKEVEILKRGIKIRNDQALMGVTDKLFLSIKLGFAEYEAKGKIEAVGRAADLVEANVEKDMEIYRLKTVLKIRGSSLRMKRNPCFWRLGGKMMMMGMGRMGKTLRAMRGGFQKYMLPAQGRILRLFCDLGFFDFLCLDLDKWFEKVYSYPDWEFIMA